MKKFAIGLLILLLGVVLGCSSPEPTDPPPIAGQPELSDGQPQSASGLDTLPLVKLVDAYPGLSFSQPVEYVQATDGSNRIWVVEKGGRILMFENDSQVQSADIFLDITSRVDSRASEKGLLGLAFHPRFSENGFFYIDYTNRTDTVVARYRVDLSEPDRGLIDSEQIILTIPQPYSNHNGGHLAFGPDGYLYIAVGDGGSAGDPQGNGQNRGTLLGKILRIDVDKPSGNLSYGIPADNPFNGRQDGARPEIFAYGFRNPWKFSFDRLNGRLWVADVGQDSIEEIDVVEKGLNYGWNVMEGSQCYPASRQCSAEGLQLPVWEYRHPIGGSVTGGYVYYGDKFPGMKGAYIYGDFVSGSIWALRLDASGQVNNQLLLKSQLNIASFGLDGNNEIYVVDLDGKIYKFDVGSS